MVICLERGADLHMAQLMPLPLTVSRFRLVFIARCYASAVLTIGPCLSVSVSVCLSQVGVLQKWLNV